MHSRPTKVNADYWEAKIAGNRRRDAETDAILADRGWRVLRFWEHEDLSLVVASIEDALRQGPTPQPRCRS